MPVGNIVNLYYRGEHTASQTSHFLDGKHLFGVGIVSLRDMEISMKGVIDSLAALDVAGRPDADANHVTTRGSMAELVIEGGYAGDYGRCYLGQFADVFECIRRQIPELRLNGLEYFEDFVLRIAETLDGLINKFQINFAHRVYRVGGPSRSAGFWFTYTVEILDGADVHAAVCKGGRSVTFLTELTSFQLLVLWHRLGNYHCALGGQ